MPLATPASARTWHVKPDGSGDAPTIQEAILAASEGDTILLAPGIFSGPGNFNINFFGLNLVVTSELGPTVTTIDCQRKGRGFEFYTDETAASIVEGLTITNGYSDSEGAGIHITHSNPTIQNNIILGNFVDGVGGGVFVRHSRAIIQNNTITENGAIESGAGIAVGVQGDPLILHNLITFSSDGNGFSCVAASSKPLLTCNNIFGNRGGDGFCGIDGSGNISSNPQFCGLLGSGNYYLQSDSPCSRNFSPCGNRLGALPIQCGSVWTQSKTLGGLKAMFGK